MLRNRLGAVADPVVRIGEQSLGEERLRVIEKPLNLTHGQRSVDQFSHHLVVPNPECGVIQDHILVRMLSYGGLISAAGYRSVD